jgi:hypothetical protein
MRQGGGTDVEPEHYDEVLGSSEFFIYVSPSGKLKGYDDLKKFLQAQGCDVQFPADSPLLPGPKYQAVMITKSGEILSPESLRRAHKWAHQRNFLHHFFRPLIIPKS